MGLRWDGQGTWRKGSRRNGWVLQSLLGHCEDLGSKFQLTAYQLLYGGGWMGVLREAEEPTGEAGKLMQGRGEGSTDQGW